jgi:hypothetical protein
MLFVDLPSSRIETLADRGEDVFMLRAVRFGLCEVCFLWLFELDAHTVLAALALMTVWL